MGKPATIGAKAGGRSVVDEQANQEKHYENKVAIEEVLQEEPLQKVRGKRSWTVSANGVLKISPGWRFMHLGGTPVAPMSILPGVRGKK